MRLLDAMALLLRDGPLRKRFGDDSNQVANELRLDESDRGAFLQISPLELQRQAEVLLHKRFDTVLSLIPVTAGNLGKECWHLFLKFTWQAPWPVRPENGLDDAWLFLQFLMPQHYSLISGCEWNLMKFRMDRARIRIHLFRSSVEEGRIKSGLQLLWKKRRGIGQIRLTSAGTVWKCGEKKSQKRHLSQGPAKARQAQVVPGL